MRIYLLLAALILSGCAAKSTACLKVPESIQDTVITRGGGSKKSKCDRQRQIEAALLRPDRSQLVVVEVDYVRGSKPSKRAIRHFEKRLGQALNKPIKILLSRQPIPRNMWDWDAPGGSKTQRESRRNKTAKFIAKQATHNERGEAYIYVISGPENMTKGEKTWLGAGYSACFFGGEVDYPVIALFQKNLSMFTGASVLVHEAGHVLGLPGRSHRTKKRGHGNHCTSPSCVLYPNPDVRSVLWQALPTLFSVQVPTKFCKKCQKTLEKQRKGREG